MDAADNYEYCLIGEAVAPEFDFNDFTWMTEKMLSEAIQDERLLKYFQGSLFDENE